MRNPPLLALARSEVPALAADTDDVHRGLALAGRADGLDDGDAY